MSEFIFGPPGTGKTTTLLDIVDEALSEGIESNEIGYFSFTRKATDEAINRAVKNFNRKHKEFPYFKTLHALARFCLHLDRTSIMQDEDYEDFSNIIGIKIHNPSSRLEEFGATLHDDDHLSLIDRYRIKKTSLYEEFKHHGHLEGGWKKLDKLDRGFTAFKTARHLFDFTDMLKALILDEEKIPFFKVLIIDEAQDLSPLQWELVDKLILRSTRVYVAADDDQAIFGWTGANVTELLKRANEPGNTKRVLHQSYRIPLSIHPYATALINRNKNREPKIWHPRKEKGLITFPNYKDFSLFQEGNWLILASTGYQLDKICSDMKHRGIFFSRKGYASVSQSILDAMFTWENLLKGNAISLEDVKLIYKYISSKVGLKWGAKKMEGATESETFTFDKLKGQYGLLVEKDTPWHVGLDRINEREERLIKSLLKKKEDLRKPPRITASTIHGAKGGEADKVMLLTDISRKGLDAYYKDAEEMRKVFYTGMTRAKQELHVIAPETEVEFGEIRYEHQKRKR
jgi:DNA helicase-2/ATP-dependent DNA helicase PcrA